MTPQDDKKGRVSADIPAEAIEEALRSIEKAPEVANGAQQPEPVEEAVTLQVEPPPQDPATPGDPAIAALTAEVENLKAQLELSQGKSREMLAKLKDEHEHLLRSAADLDNYRKRVRREQEDLQKFANEKLLKDFLPVVDSLDRALQAAPVNDPLADGVKLVRKTLEDSLARHGVKAFSALGQPFDPQFHEALLQVPSDRPVGTVVVEHGRGFMLNDRLVRPAMVGVAVALPTPRAPPEPATTPAPAVEEPG